MTAQVAQAAFPKGCLAIRVRDTLGELFEDGQFAGLFAVRGRPAVSPARLALVSVLQFAEGLSDRQAADAVRGRIDWKYALGLELADTGFDASVLSEFRARLAADDQAERLLGQMLARLRERGLLVRGGRQRTDATHVLAAVRELNRLELVTETLRAALEALAAERALPVTVGATGALWLPARQVEELSAAVRQALDNVVEHADASRVALFAEEDAGAVVLTVRDDGRGFTYDERRLLDQGKIGLAKSIKGRVEQLGGSMVVTSRPGAGTEIELRVPTRGGNA
jgi:transposase